MFKISHLELVRSENNFASLVRGLIEINGVSTSFQVLIEDAEPMQYFKHKPIRETNHKKIYAFIDDIPVTYSGMASTTHKLIEAGWKITIEYNRYTGKSKVVLTNPDGLMAKLPYADSAARLDIPVLYAVNNYRTKAKKITEFDCILDWYELISKEDIPFLLSKIRELEKEAQVELLWELYKNPSEIEDKVIQLAEQLYKKAA